MLWIGQLLACGLAVDGKDNFGATRTPSTSIPTRAASVHRLLALQGLLENMQRVVHFWILGTLASDLANRMQHGRVIAAAKQLADLRQAFLCQLLGQVR